MAESTPGHCSSVDAPWLFECISHALYDVIINHDVVCTVSAPGFLLRFSCAKYLSGDATVCVSQVGFSLFFASLFFSPEQCPLLCRTDFDFTVTLCFISWASLWPLEQITCRHNGDFITVPFLMRQIPFRDAYLQSIKNRNCTKTKIRKDAFLTQHHTLRQKLWLCFSLNLLLVVVVVTFFSEGHPEP